MPANTSYNPEPNPLTGNAIQIVVYLYGRDTDDYEALPNIRCESINRHEGPSPPTAQFSYVFDDTDPNSPYPSQFEQVWPIVAQGPYIIQNDDELVVVGYTDQGVPRLIFDGFAQIPQVDMARDSQSVTFTAVGVAIRCWDGPIGGAVYRQSYATDSTDKKDTVATDLPTRFNPSKDDEIQPNCTPKNKDVNEGEKIEHPVFLDSNLRRDPDPRTFWTLGGMARYLMFEWNDEEYIKNPDFRTLDDLLKARKPKSGNFYDPNKASTYTATDIEIRDFDATNQAWPDAINEELAYSNFAMFWQLTQDDDNFPVNMLKIFRKDASAAVAPKRLMLQKGGPMVVLDPGQSNTNEIHMARDLNKVSNEYEIETDPKVHEVGIVLAPLFKIDAADAADAARKQFLKSALQKATGDIRAKYRDYGADEAGDGHWSYDDNSLKTNTQFDLDDVFGAPEPANDDSGDQIPTYVKRLRKPEGELITKDSDGKPLKAQLLMSRDYDGDAPAVWDKTGTWQLVSGGWKLMDDRIGIEVTASDPEEWNIGEPVMPDGKIAQNNGNDLRGITSQANPSDDNLGTKRFYLLLVCVIPADEMMDVKAEKRDASPTDFTVIRRIDAKDHFKYQSVHTSSPNSTGNKPKVVRDDTEKAEAYAEALRSAHEFPPLAGTAVIPWLTNSYDIGDRLQMIDGRGVSFQTNLGTNSGEAPMFPYIIGITYDFSNGGQQTRLEFSDRLPEPEKV